MLLRSTNALTLTVTPLIGLFFAVMANNLFKMFAAASIHPADLLPVITGVTNALILLLLSSSFGAAFTHLYLSRDMPLLLAAPIRPRDVIFSKIVEVTVLGSPPFWIVAIPMLLAFGKAWHAPPWFYPLAVAASLPLAILPALVAILLNLVVSRVIPPYKSREMLAAMSTILGGVIYLAVRLAGSSVKISGGPETLRALFTRWGPSWSPTTLFARALAEGMLDNPLPLVGTAFILTAASFATFLSVVPWTEKAYVSGWASYGEAAGTGRGTRGLKNGTPIVRAESETATLRTGEPVRPIVLRERLGTEILSFKVEAHLLFRDLQAQSQVLYLMIMMLAWSIVPSRDRAEGALSAYATVASFITLAGSYSSWSLKNSGATSRILRVAPCDPARVMRGKAAFYGTVQSACILTLLALMSLRGTLAGAVRELPFIAVALSYSTAAVTVCGIASAPNVVNETGMPRTPIGTGIVMVLVNGLLSISGCVSLFLIGRSEALWVKTAHMIVFLVVQGFVFSKAAVMARGYVLGARDTK